MEIKISDYPCGGNTRNIFTDIEVDGEMFRFQTYPAGEEYVACTRGAIRGHELRDHVTCSRHQAIIELLTWSLQKHEQ